MTRKYRLICYAGLILFSWLSQLIYPFANIVEVIGWTAGVLLMGLVVEIINSKKNIE